MMIKNPHRSFYQGLWSLTDDYKVIVAKERFDEAGDVAFLLKKMKGKQVHLPKNREYWPEQRNLEWHRDRCFQLR